MIRNSPGLYETVLPSMIRADCRIGGGRRLYLADAWTQLVRIPDEMKKCVVFLTYEVPDFGGTARELFAGTAFNLGVREGERIFFYLVTAAHIIQGIQAKGIATVKVRVNKASGSAENIDVPISDWSFHPSDPAVDVAVTYWPHWKDQDIKVFPIEAIATSEVIRQEGIGIGDEIFVVGLYTKHSGQSRNEPIVRVGNLAAMPEEPCTTSRGPMDAYLVEIRSVGGISGSPVFVRPGPFVRWPTDPKQFISVGGEFYLLGVMHGRWDMKSIAPVLHEIDATDIGAPVNSGIAVVAPATKILDIINQPLFAKERSLIIELIRRQDATTTDSDDPSQPEPLNKRESL